MNATIETDFNNGNMNIFIIIVICLGCSVPFIYCCCYCMLSCRKYLYLYGNFVENNNINNKQISAIRYLYEICFGTVAPPKLNKIIIVSLVNIKNSPIQPL